MKDVVLLAVSLYLLKQDVARLEFQYVFGLPAGVRDRETVA
jgi:hypothetical protein